MTITLCKCGRPAPIATSIDRPAMCPCGQSESFIVSMSTGPGVTPDQIASEIRRVQEHLAEPINNLIGRLSGMAFLLNDRASPRTDVRTMMPVTLTPHEKYRQNTDRQAAKLLSEAAAMLTKLKDRP